MKRFLLVSIVMIIKSLVWFKSVEAQAQCPSKIIIYIFINVLIYNNIKK
jgi:hypothetical protein